MVDSQRGGQRRVGYNHLTSSKREWINCFIRNVPKIQKTKPNNNKTTLQITRTDAKHVRRAWYNGPYTVMAKPMKPLELHYPVIQFLTIKFTLTWFRGLSELNKRNHIVIEG